jgi:hypothetical protein
VLHASIFACRHRRKGGLWEAESRKHEQPTQGFAALRSHCQVALPSMDQIIGFPAEVTLQNGVVVLGTVSGVDPQTSRLMLIDGELCPSWSRVGNYIQTLDGWKSA